MRISRRSGKRGVGLTAMLGTAALFLAVSLPPALGGDKDVEINTETTVTITPTSETTAVYEGVLTTTPARKGKGKKEQARRRNLASRCKDNRKVVVIHGSSETGFLIGTVRTDDRGRWSITGNKPPTGDVINVKVRLLDLRDVLCLHEDVITHSP